MTAHHVGHLVAVTVYPHTPGAFTRSIDLAEEFPRLAARGFTPFLDADDATLVLYMSPAARRIDVSLPGWSWGRAAL